MALVLRCGGCGRLPGRTGAYPTASGVALCGHCAYARGVLCGKSRAKYVRRHPLRAAFCRGAAMFKRLRARWRLESRRMREQERFLCPHGRVVCLPMIGADPCEGHGPDSENYRAWKKWSEEFDRAARAAS